MAILSLFTFIAAIAVASLQSRRGGGVSGVYYEKAGTSGLPESVDLSSKSGEAVMGRGADEYSPADEQLKGSPRH